MRSITHLEDLQLLRTARRVKDHAIACSGLHQRAGQWRHPADVVAIQIDLVDADDAHHPLRSRGVGVAHGRSEEDLRRRPPASRGFRVHDFRGIDPFREKANPPIDLAQPPFAVLIVGVFAAIAVARRPGHDLCHRRPFPGEQKPSLVFESLQAARRDVVLDSSHLGGCGFRRRSPREPFLHPVLPIRQGSDIRPIVTSSGISTATSASPAIRPGRAGDRIVLLRAQATPSPTPSRARRPGRSR